MPIEPVMLRTTDGLTLEGELEVPESPWAAVVIAHPHPQHGGSMRAVVPSALWEGLPSLGVACLRFNFRGVGSSEGTFGEGVGESLDIVAAIDLIEPIVEGLPLIVAGASFGGDTALAVGDERLAGWFCAGAPLRIVKRHDMVAAEDPRPKLLAVPQNDEYLDPSAAEVATADWVNTAIEVVPGVGHYFVGRLHVLPPLCTRFLETLAPD